ncbi:uncharacterized protein CELE_F21H12.3 [Caenorhabditis elegans]|uniref:Uncharacterized protein n=1 Tax=Caenorhabditis elegans TaxID=6239 RepID=UPI000BC2331F|nr:Uncharacterized protein CELE_F21H12.3 [Caenorhabditis elegans]CCD66117.2 Uncharacterized protein CELE_F21H12.3 [Caenorhabditis elegans]|eukprot:NP_001343630.1 Uncharacterized protein CELE_F21H12.3 [Caenorhabditis elegans]
MHLLQDLFALLKHAEIMKHIASFNVSVHGVDWSLSDICFKPAPPSVAADSAASSLGDVIDMICIWITPIDYFCDGSKAFEPHPSLPKSSLRSLGTSLSALSVDDMIRWSDFGQILFYYLIFYNASLLLQDLFYYGISFTKNSTSRSFTTIGYFTTESLFYLSSWNKTFYLSSWNKTRL